MTVKKIWASPMTEVLRGVRSRKIQVNRNLRRAKNTQLVIAYAIGHEARIAF